MRVCRQTGETETCWAAGQSSTAQQQNLITGGKGYYSKIKSALKNSLFVIFSTGRPRLISFCPISSHHFCVCHIPSQ